MHLHVQAFQSLYLDEKCNICSYSGTQLQRDQLWHSSAVETTHMRAQMLLPDLFSDKDITKEKESNIFYRLKPCPQLMSEAGVIRVQRGLHDFSRN